MGHELLLRKDLMGCASIHPSYGSPPILRVSTHPTGLHPSYGSSCFLLPASCFLLPAPCSLLPASCFFSVAHKISSQPIRKPVEAPVAHAHDQVARPGRPK